MRTRIPLAFARSGLFAPSERSVGTLRNHVVPAAGYTNWAVSMEYSGAPLTPAHAFVWQAVVALVKADDQLHDVEISARALLALLGRRSAETTTKRWLTGLLCELTGARVTLQTPAQAFSGPLLDTVEILPGGMLRITLPPEILPLLINEFARVRLEDKHGLTQHPMAAWLFDWCATLKAGFSIPLAELQRMCGNQASVGTFRRTVTAALNVLVERKAIDGYTIERGVLKLAKPPGKVVLLTGQREANVQRRTSVRTAAQHANRNRVHNYL